MGYINVFVSNEAHISVKNNQLTLTNAENKIDYPLEDLNSILIENHKTTLSAYTLSMLAEYGILTFICNKSHIPSGILLPYCEHYQTLTCYEKQINISKPLQKNLWKKIIQNKIANQNEVLNMCGGADCLKPLIVKVLSGDSSNVEAQASVVYFKELFNSNFKRREESATNSFLNYGYSIIRGFVARSIVAHGLMPFLGINHKNQYNQFNLADDLMEVFRPMVDLYVKIHLSEEKELTPKIKAELYNIVNLELLVNNQKQSVSYAIELFVQSFVKTITDGVDNLKEIKIVGLNLHNYE